MQRLLNRLGSIGVGIAIVGSAVNSALYNVSIQNLDQYFIVDGGQRAVIFDRFTGVKKNVTGEGTHFLVPWVQRPIIFSIRSTPRNVAVVTGSRVTELPNIYMNIGQDYAERVLPSITQEVLKAVVAQFDASELITNREIVSMQVRDSLMQRAQAFGLILDDISITHLTFGREFSEAVELKQVAQQEAERARFVVEMEEQVKLARIIKAEGDSKGAELVSEALQKAGDGLIELRKLEAAEEICSNLSRAKNVAYLPGGQNVLLNLQHV